MYNKQKLHITILLLFTNYDRKIKVFVEQYYKRSIRSDNGFFPANIILLKRNLKRWLL